MQNFIPNHIHTGVGSLLDGFCKIDKLSKRCKKLGYKSCMITDHGNISACINFHTEMSKNGIKPIIGNEFYCSHQDSCIKNNDNRSLFHTVVIAKNKESYFKLVKATSLSNHPDNYYYKPRLDLKKLASIIGDSCFIFSGHPGSYLWDCKTVEECVNGINYLKSLFGENNVIVEIQRFLNHDDVNEHIKILEKACALTGTKKIACADIHYVNKKDAEAHRVLLCSNLKLTLPQINNMSDKPMSTFFESEKFYLFSQEELVSFGHTQDELDFSIIESQCEQYELKDSPKLPKFSENESQAISELCKDGWNRKCNNWDEKYHQRLNYELDVFNKNNLNGYFLIVSDYMKWAKKRMLCGPGRGSSSGSLASYLLDITEIDPIENGLIFERFFNPGRAGSLPDIDSDFPANKREDVIQYIKEKYGEEYICQIATFSALKGKSALKEVFRVYEACDFDTANEITKKMPDESEISDELEEQNEESIIRWCLINDPDMFKNYCKLTENGLEGDYAHYFDVAIQLEGTYKNYGKHAAGIIISNEKIADIAPLFYDQKTGMPIVAFDKKDAEKVGLVKFDILGLSALDVLMGINNLLRTGKLNAD